MENADVLGSTSLGVHRKTAIIGPEVEPENTVYRINPIARGRFGNRTGIESDFIYAREIRARRLRPEALMERGWIHQLTGPALARFRKAVSDGAI